MVNWTPCFHKFDGLVPSFMREILILVYFPKNKNTFNQVRTFSKPKHRDHFGSTIVKLKKVCLLNYLKIKPS